MDIRHLKNFVAIVDCGSLSKAADLVYIAQPALSQQLAGLESELGAQLLVRSRRGVLPTEAGKVLYRHARTVMRQIEQLHVEMTLPGPGEIGPVAVGLSATMVSMIAVPLFERVRARHPGIRLHLFEAMSGYIGELLGIGRLDMAIQFMPSETRGINVQPLLEEYLYVVGDSKEAGKGDTCELAELDGVPVILPLSAQGIRMLIERSFAQSGLDLNVVADVDSVRGLVEIARHGGVRAILPLSSLAPRYPDDSLTVRKLVSPSLCRSVGLAWSKLLPHTSAAAAVRRIIVELATELVRTDRWPGAVLRETSAD